MTSRHRRGFSLGSTTWTRRGARWTGRKRTSRVGSAQRGGTAPRAASHSLPHGRRAASPPRAPRARPSCTGRESSPGPRTAVSRRRRAGDQAPTGFPAVHSERRSSAPRRRLVPHSTAPEPVTSPRGSSGPRPVPAPVTRHPPGGCRHTQPGPRGSAQRSGVRRGDTARLRSTRPFGIPGSFQLVALPSPRARSPPLKPRDRARGKQKHAGGLDGRFPQPAGKWLTSLPPTVYWLELNHMAPPNCRGGWEM